MKMNDSSKSSFFLDSAILLLYFILSPFVFGFFYPEEIHGEGGLLYIVILFITGITLFCSVLITYIVRRIFQTNKWVDLGIGLIPLIVSFLTIRLLFQDLNLLSLSTFIKSNSIEIIFLYLCVFIYKRTKKSA
jgi:hypothetical protein